MDFRTHTFHVSHDERLLCEGYLRKHRGFFQNRVRWFTLTTETLSFFRTEHNILISSIDVKLIQSVVDEGGRYFGIRTTSPFGASKQTYMVLSAANVDVKRRWLLAFAKAEVTVESSFVDDRLEAEKVYETHDDLIAEGHLCKVKPFGHANKVRWFQLYTTHISYFTCESGKEMARLDIDKISRVCPFQESGVIVESALPFSASGCRRMILVADTQTAILRWKSALKHLVGRRFQNTFYTSLSQMHKSFEHQQTFNTPRAYFGCRQEIAQKQDNGPPKESEGNRFIVNGML